MTKSFSSYLDGVRFLAALAVFIHHFGTAPISEHVIWPPLGQYGDPAVIIFFVLSGYVISFVVDTREATARDFVAARIARLYSVIAIALPLTLVCDWIGLSAAPNLYESPWVLAKPESWIGYFSSLLLVNEWQSLHLGGVSLGSNAPWWSLSFEGTYYLLAGLALFMRRQGIRIAGCLLVLGLAGRTIFLLLPLWLLGFYLYRAKQLHFESRLLGWIAAVSTAALFLALPSIRRYVPYSGNYIFLPWGPGPYNRSLANDYLVGVLFATHLIGMRSLLGHTSVSPFGRLAAPLRWLGTLTFPLYLLHYPLICMLTAVVGLPRTSPRSAFIVGSLTMLIVIALTPLSELLKRRIRNIVLRAWPSRDEGLRSRGVP